MNFEDEGATYLVVYLSGVTVVPICGDFILYAVFCIKTEQIKIKPEKVSMNEHCAQCFEFFFSWNHATTKKSIR